jgi:hypothetical protein
MQYNISQRCAGMREDFPYVNPVNLPNVAKKSAVNLMYLTIQGEKHENQYSRRS